MENLTPIQNAIFTALDALSEKTTFTEAIIAKKIRETEKIQGNKKAVIPLADLEKAVEKLAEQKQIFYSVKLNSANDLILTKAEQPLPLQQDARHRRLQSEKSMTIFKSSDLNKKEKPKNKSKMRTERKSFRTNIDLDQLDY